MKKIRFIVSVLLVMISLGCVSQAQEVHSQLSNQVQDQSITDEKMLDLVDNNKYLELILADASKGTLPLLINHDVFDESRTAPGNYFSEYLTITNPNTVGATAYLRFVNVEYITDLKVNRKYSLDLYIGANSSVKVKINGHLPVGGGLNSDNLPIGGDFSAILRVTNSLNAHYSDCRIFACTTLYNPPKNVSIVYHNSSDDLVIQWNPMNWINEFEVYREEENGRLTLEGIVKNSSTFTVHNAHGDGKLYNKYYIYARKSREYAPPILLSYPAIIQYE